MTTKPITHRATFDGLRRWGGDVPAITPEQFYERRLAAELAKSAQVAAYFESNASNVKRPVWVDGVEYASACEAERETGISRRVIERAADGKPARTSVGGRWREVQAAWVGDQ